MDLELDIRTRRDEPDFEIVRPLTRDDLELLSDRRGSRPTPILELRERHHAAARLFASGRPNWEVAAMTGYSISRLSILLGDPTFKDLVEFYRGVVDAQYHDLHERLAGMAVDAADELRDRLENEPDEVSTGQLMEMVKLGADRTGHGPTSTNVQVNVGLAARLEAARKRVKMIDVSPKEDAA